MNFQLFKSHIVKADVFQELDKVFDSGYLNEGEFVTELTNKLSSFLGSQNIALVNSCTSALTLALKLSGVDHLSEVISTPMTCVATNTPIKSLGAKIVWADIDAKSGMIDPDDVERKITSKTKAVIAVAWAGNPPELIRLRKICAKRGVKLICDAAHAFGATINSIPISNFSDFTCFSFQAIKHFSTGGSGAIICSSQKDFERVKSLKWFGLDRDKAKNEKGDWKGQQWDVDIEEAGFKFNMNNVAAAIGIAQLRSVEFILQTHNKNAKLLTSLLDVDTIIPAAHKDGSSNWVFSMVVNNDKLDRDTLISKLNEKGVAAGLVHVRNDFYTCFSESKSNLPGVDSFSACQFSIPCGWWLSSDDIVQISKIVKETINESLLV